MRETSRGCRWIVDLETGALCGSEIQPYDVFLVLEIWSHHFTSCPHHVSEFVAEAFAIATRPRNPFGAVQSIHIEPRDPV